MASKRILKELKYAKRSSYFLLCCWSTPAVTRQVDPVSGAVGDAELGAPLLPFGLNGLGSSGGAGSGMFGTGLPDFEQMQQQFTQNPNMMREIMDLPLIQNLSENLICGTRDCSPGNLCRNVGIIVGYAQNGLGTEALGIFEEMLASGEKPDHVTMIGVLCACSHVELVEEGRKYFFSMTTEYGVDFTCMVDLLGRAGCPNEARNPIEKMPMQPDAVVWGSLLAACKVHSNLELGEYAAEKLLEIDPNNSGPYVLLSNMYAELGRWKDVTRVRKLMRHPGVVKQPGCSWIEFQGDVHVFMVKDKRHPQIRQIYLHLKTLTKVMKLFGYTPNVDDLEANEEQGTLDVPSCPELEGPLNLDVA